MNDDHGWVTLWILGLCLMVLSLGGLAIDLWRAITERRELAAMADAAAIAGSSGVDTMAWRESGEVLLDADLAIERANVALAAQPGAAELAGAPVVIIDGDSITVELSKVVPFTLLRLVAGAADPFVVRVSATSRAALGP